MFIFGVITGIALSILNVILVYIFRAEIHSALKHTPLTKGAEFIEMEDPLEHVKKLLNK